MLQEVITADVVEFEAARSAFDRVVSIEMFEHMKNYQARPMRPAAPCLTQQLASFLSPVVSGTYGMLYL